MNFYWRRTELINNVRTIIKQYFRFFFNEVLKIDEKLAKIQHYFIEYSLNLFLAHKTDLHSNKMSLYSAFFITS
jgi:hypothetical protein